MSSKLNEFAIYIYISIMYNMLNKNIAIMLSGVNMMKLSEIIKNYRKEYNIPLDMLAEKSGLSKGYLSMLENDRNPRTGKPITPSLDALRKLAKGMRTDLDNLISIMDDQNVDIRIPKRKSDLEMKVSDDMMPLSKEESMIIYGFRKLNDDGKKKIYDYFADILDNRKYTKKYVTEKKEA